MSTDPTCPHCGKTLSEHVPGHCLDAWAAQCAGSRSILRYSQDIAAAMELWNTLGRRSIVWRGSRVEAITSDSTFSGRSQDLPAVITKAYIAAKQEKDDG